MSLTEKAVLEAKIAQAVYLKENINAELNYLANVSEKTIPEIASTTEEEQVMSEIKQTSIRINQYLGDTINHLLEDYDGVMYD